MGRFRQHAPLVPRVASVSSAAAQYHDRAETEGGRAEGAEIIWPAWVQRCGIGSSCECPPQDQLAGVQRDLDHATTGGGAALPAATQAAMGRAFSADFSSVRVHTGPASDRVASGLGASALTAGQDIVFRAGAFRPHTPGGDRLLAHELAHVVQQAGGLPRAAIDGGTADPLEKAAETAADQAVTSGRVAGLGPAPSAREGDLRAAGPGRRAGPGRGVPELAGRTTGQTGGATEIVQRAPPTAGHAAAPTARPPTAAAPSDLSDTAEIDQFTTLAISVWQTEKDKSMLYLAAMLRGEVDSVLRKSAVPVPDIHHDETAKEGSSANGVFSLKDWSLTLYWGAILQTKLTGFGMATLMGAISFDYVKLVADAIYHETRHCEQAFMGAREAAHETPGTTADELATEVGIPVHVAAAALKAPPLSGAQKKQAETFRAFNPGGEHNDYHALAESFTDTTERVRKYFDDEKLTDLIERSDLVSTTVNIYTTKIGPRVDELRKKRNEIALMTADKAVTAVHFHTTLDKMVYYTLHDILSKLDAVLAADKKLDLNLITASVILNEKAAHLLPDEDSVKIDYRAREQSWDDWAVLQEATRKLDKAVDDAYHALPDEADSYRLGNAVLVQLDLKGRTH
jgi:hypothetical protein